MITHLEGVLVEKSPAHAVIDCGGVGYFLNISLNTFSKLPENGRLKLYTHLAIREDAHVLFGFADKAERELFLQLTSVSGIGPATARMILSSMSPEELHRTIVTRDLNRLRSVKGVGPKSAERILIDLKDKLAKEGLPSEISFTPHNKVREEALSALVMLGFAKAVAEKAVDKALKEKGNTAPVEDVIKTALNNL
jgi:holliday junction DNA helicase RuvA